MDRQVGLWRGSSGKQRTKLGSRVTKSEPEQLTISTYQSKSMAIPATFPVFFEGNLTRIADVARADSSAILPNVRQNRPSRTSSSSINLTTSDGNRSASPILRRTWGPRQRKSSPNCYKSWQRMSRTKSRRLGRLFGAQVNRDSLTTFRQATSPIDASSAAMAMTVPE